MENSKNKRQPRIRNCPMETVEKKGTVSPVTNGYNKVELLREIGNRLRKIRLDRGWTQDGMAELIGITKAFYGKIERGESSIALEKLVLLNDKMDIDLNYLITGVKSPVLPVEFQNIPREKRYGMEQLIKYAISLASSKEEP